MIMDEATVWASARDGDPTAFGAIFDAHRDRVFGQALRLMRSPHDAEDVTALVFLEAWRRRDRVRVVDGSIIGWLLVTTTNVARNFIRTLKRHRAAMERIPVHEGVADHTETVDSKLDRRTSDLLVNNAFAQLSPNDQRIITLCILEDLTVAQAAEVLGIPSGTVKSRLSRAKQRLSVLTEKVFSQPTTLSGGAL